MKRFLDEKHVRASCTDQAYSECMRANAGFIDACNGDLPCNKYVVYLKSGSHIWCDESVNSLQEADFIAEGNSGRCDMCWIEKCVGGEWVTVKTVFGS